MADDHVGQLYTTKSLATLAGASAAALIVPGVCGYVFNFNPRWLGLLVAELIAFVGLTQLPKQTKRSAVVVVITLLNGFLIYSDSVGLNALHHAQEPNAKEHEADALWFIDPKPWWPAGELVEKVRVQHGVITESARALADAHAALQNVGSSNVDFVAVSRSRRGALEGELNKLNEDLKRANVELDRSSEMGPDRVAAKQKIIQLRAGIAKLDASLAVARVVEQQVAEIGTVSTISPRAVETEYMRAKVEIEHARSLLDSQLRSPSSETIGS